jgi:unsaturated rhamnogalacturonyl hydrolase
MLALIGCATAPPPQPIAAPALAPAPVEPAATPLPAISPITNRVPRIPAIVRALEAVRTRVESATPTTLPSRYVMPSTETETPHHFSLLTYPTAVIYSGMLSAADATGDKSFADFDVVRFQLFADALANVDPDRIASYRGPLRLQLNPRTLDDCGAIGAALVKARRAGIGPDLKLIIDRIDLHISQQQLRLDDGTLARPRPFRNSVWADDAYMSVPFLAQMGALTGDQKYFDDASHQILGFEAHLFVPSVGLFNHHWNTGNPDDQPRYFWGRANGWCMVALVELLDVLPEDHPQRADLLKLLRAHAQGIASVQGGEGFWHQMLDRPDSFTETSCTAMFTYSLARGVDRGWLDADAYGPVAIAGWNALATRIDADGDVTGTCIGTGYADDYAYYYNRPHIDDVHGYGPVLLAGSEMIRMLKSHRYGISGGGRDPIMFNQPLPFMDP